MFAFGEHVSEAITAEITTDISVPGSRFHAGTRFEPGATFMSRIHRFSPYVVIV
jgi:hypothetical protein